MQQAQEVVQLPAREHDALFLVVQVATLHIAYLYVKYTHAHLYKCTKYTVYLTLKQIHKIH